MSWVISHPKALCLLPLMAKTSLHSTQIILFCLNSSRLLSHSIVTWAWDQSLVAEDLKNRYNRIRLLAFKTSFKTYNWCSKPRLRAAIRCRICSCSNNWYRINPKTLELLTFLLNGIISVVVPRYSSVLPTKAYSMLKIAFPAALLPMMANKS